MVSHTFPTRIFTLEDVSVMERRYGVAYFRTRNAESMLPATHIGHHAIGLISTSSNGELVNWKVWDPDGNLLIHSTEHNYHRNWAGWFRAMRNALRSLRIAGCEFRVRPGDRGPWGPGVPL